MARFFSGPVIASKPVAMTMMSSGYSLPPARMPFCVISSIGPSVLACRKIDHVLTDLSATSQLVNLYTAFTGLFWRFPDGLRSICPRGLLHLLQRPTCFCTNQDSLSAHVAQSERCRGHTFVRSGSARLLERRSAGPNGHDIQRRHQRNAVRHFRQ